MGRTTGDGTIEVREGKYRVRLPRTLDPQRRSRTFDTREEAESFLRGASAILVEAPQYAPDGQPTLRGYGEKWLARREINGSRSVDTEQSFWRNHIATAHFADWPLTRITRDDLKEWLDSLKKKRALERAAWKPAEMGRRKSRRTLSWQTRVHCRNLLAKCLADALEEKLIQANPAVGIKIVNDNPTEEDWTYLTADEIEQVHTSKAIPAEERDIYLTAIYTGMREGELWGLRWRNVFLDEANPRIETRRSHRGTTKNRKVRHVPLFQPALEALKRQRARRSHAPDDLVFPTVTGLQRPRSDDAGWGDRIKEKGEVVHGYKTLAGIARRVRFHDLRHTCASHLVMGTWGRQCPRDSKRPCLMLA
jgi:integrase